MANSTKNAPSVLVVCKLCAYVMLVIARSVARAEPLHNFPMSGSNVECYVTGLIIMHVG